MSAASDCRQWSAPVNSASTAVPMFVSVSMSESMLCQFKVHNAMGKLHWHTSHPVLHLPIQKRLMYGQDWKEGNGWHQCQQEKKR